MKRDYKSGVTESVTFFVGHEIEHTPAHGLYTLFVVGVHDPEVILDLIRSRISQGPVIKHIYFGANQSFNPTGRAEWLMWVDMIHVCLEADYWCTLDLDPSHIETLLDYGLTEKRRFIPQISVKLPYLHQLGYNATIKLDDVDFNASNPGVWCHSLHNLQTRDTFTGWDEYSKDEIIK